MLFVEAMDDSRDELAQLREQVQRQFVASREHFLDAASQWVLMRHSFLVRTGEQPDNSAAVTRA